MSELAACTIVSANYLPFARVLARSFREAHPQARFFTLLVDRVEGRFGPAEEPFELIQVEQLAIPDLAAFLFKYTVLEANTAVKPWFLEHLFDHCGVERLLYLDPDIQVFEPLDPLFERLATSPIVLLPHLTSPLDGPGLPDELTIMRSGTYNLGFLGVADVPAAREFLHWWRDRTYDRCIVRLEDGLFVDQKWVDLVPGLWADVAVVRDPGYDVAYWNLNARRVTVSPGPRVDGEPLYFFHFSGLNPENPKRISKYQDRLRWSDLGDAGKLYLDYADRVLEAGWRSTRDWHYAFADFDNGVRVPDLARRLFLDLGPGRSAFGNPFSTRGEASFWAWLAAPVRRGGPPHLTRILAAAHAGRPDLVAAFPDPAGADLAAFADWLEVHAQEDFGIKSELLEPVRGALTGGLPARSARRARVSATAARARATTAFKEGVKNVLGPKLTGVIKRRLRRGLEPAPAPPPPAVPSGFGVNVAGYIRTESGVGQGVRFLIGALERAGIPNGLTDLHFNVQSRRSDDSFTRFSDRFEHPISVFAVNADQVPEMVPVVGRDRLAGRYNIGYWAWELDPFPDRWLGSFEPFREIWTPSRFCADVIGAVSPIPVRRVPHAVAVTPSPGASRASFGLPEDSFLFLFMFDYMSFAERKNPIGLVRAFRRAFAGRDDVALVLKSINAGFDPEGAAALAAETGGSQVIPIDRYLDRQEVVDLVAVCDAYASLHRAEGFGLTLAEAMALGKPVVATQWSGNADFMTPANSYPVGYRLVTLERDLGPYAAGGRWADPDPDHAVEQLRRVVDDRGRAAAVGRRAAAEIHAQLGPDAVAALLRQRITSIVHRLPPPDTLDV